MIGGIIAIVALLFFLIIIGIIRKRHNEKKESHFQDLANRYQFDLFKTKSFFKGTQFELRGEYQDYKIRVHEETTGSGKNQIRYSIWTVECDDPGYNFSIGKENFFTRFGNWLGFRDIEFRDEKIDDAFRFKSDNEDKFRALMSQDLLYELPNIKDDLIGVIQVKNGVLSYRMPKELINDKIKKSFETILPYMIKIVKSRTFQ